MTFQSSNRILPGTKAFRSTAAGAAASRVAHLQTMTLGMLDRAPEPVPEVAATLDELGVTPVEGGYRDAEWGGDEDRETFARGFGLPGTATAATTATPHETPPTPPDTRSLRPVREAFDGIGDTPKPDDLKALLEASLTGPTAIERVAGAQALDRLSHGTHEPARDVLRASLASPAHDVRSIAELSSVGPLEPQPAVAATTTTLERSTGAVSFALHGTWARLSPSGWFRPGQPMHEYIREHVSADLYSRPDFPRWSGGLSEADRVAGGEGLLTWVAEHTGGEQVDAIYAHSHGGNVALEAIARGLKVHLLVLLHVPPRPREDAQWADIRDNVERTLVYRTLLDRVVLADMISTGSVGGAFSQRFDEQQLPHVDNHPDPISGPWFSHDYFTKVANWERHHVANDVTYYRGEPPMSTPVAT
jgi:hypothetical protein